jgi:hypothetical protein
MAKEKVESLKKQKDHKDDEAVKAEKVAGQKNVKEDTDKDEKLGYKMEKRREELRKRRG